MRAALAASPARLGEMGRAGAALVAQHHDAGREAARLQALFEAAGEVPSRVGVARAAAALPNRVAAKVWP
jgi:hypothetical protein